MTSIGCCTKKGRADRDETDFWTFGYCDTAWPAGVCFNFRLANPHNMAVLLKVTAAHSLIHSIDCLMTGPY